MHNKRQKLREFHQINIFHYRLKRKKDIQSVCFFFYKFSLISLEHIIALPYIFLFEWSRSAD